MRLCLAALLLISSLAAQTAKEVEVTAEPHHHLIFQNAYVRAFKVEVPPGDATLLHHHGHDFVVVTLGPAQISNQVEGKAAVSSTLSGGEILSGDAGTTHLIRNTGVTPFRNVTVELLQDAKAKQNPPPQWDEERGLDVLQSGTREILFVKDGVRVSEVELQAGGMIPKHHHVGPHLVIALTDLDLHNDVAGKAASMIHLRAGEVEWFNGNLTHTVMNMSKQTQKFVALEFH